MVVDLDTELRTERERLLRRALSPAGLSDLVELQVELAEGIKRSEVARRELPKHSEHRALWKHHDQQLRAIGDTLAWFALDSHTIRNLAKSPGRPASLSGQWSDFQFVIHIARGVAEAGALVLICDTTNILRAGDLVVLFADGKLDIIECKNVSGEAISRRRDPRVTRQISRGRWLADYLTTGQAEGIELDSLSAEGHETVHQAFEIDYEAEYDWSLLTEAMQSASETGTGLAHRSTEFVFVQRRDIPSLTNFDPPPPKSGNSGRSLFIAFGSDLIDNPSPLHPPVTYWPISVEQRLAIWERDLFICHAVAEEDLLGGSLSDESSAEITAVAPGGFIRVHVRSEEIILGPRFLDNVLLSFQTVSSMREQVLRFALAFSDPTTRPSPSPGVNYGIISKTGVTINPADQ